jgi:DNA polymerase-3 subunit gamma/tau
MAYQSLYRKYRPQRFSELVDQEHVVNALRSAVRDGRVGHAYLLSGPRGTGKTTTARILAKALNCTNLGDDGEPCGECDNCVAITAGTFLDLFELDAASNRGIENIRDVVEGATRGLATNSRTKVYVLDEVHMLTDAASNALLKTLEEAPGHVVFVLATTNPEKVLPTIRSRTQHFEFTLIATEDLIGRLADLCEREGVDADAEALAVIANAGAGSARDAESLLDQALAQSPERLGAEAITALFGGTAFSARLQILDAIASEDSAGALVGLGELLESGHEPRRVAEDLLSAIRDGFLLTAARGRVRIEAPAEDQERLRELGEILGNAALVRMIETLGQAITDMRGVDAADPRLVLEVALVRLSRREAGPPIQTVIERIERLERAGGGAVAAGAAPPTPAAAPSESGRRSRPTLGALRRAEGKSDAERASAGGVSPPAASEAVEGVSPPAASEAMEAVSPPAASEAGEQVDLDDVIVAWGAIVSDLSPATRSAVQNAQPVSFDGDVLVFGVPPEMLGAARERFKREADTVREALAGRLGKRFKFNLVADEQVSLSGSSGAPAAGGPAPAPAPDDGTAPPGDLVEEDVRPEELVDAPPDVDAAPVSRLRAELGATVVEELPREGT